MANNLKDLHFRWYDPEIWPVKSLLENSVGQNYISNVFDTESNLYVCDIPGTIVDGGLPSWYDKFEISGGGGVDLDAQPLFPKVLRFTIAVAKDGLAQSINDVIDSLGPQIQQIATPTATAWDTYTACIDSCGDDATCDECGPDNLYFGLEGTIDGFNNGGSGESTVINQLTNSMYSVCHKDLFISGWNGGQNQNANDQANYQGNNTNPDADYTLTEDDVTNNTLDILSGTEFGKDGAYEAEFEVGERVRIFGWKNTVDLNENLQPNGNSDIDKLFRGEYPWSTFYDPSPAWSLGPASEGLATNTYGKGEDIDGIGFHSPFFYSLWRATEYEAHDEILDFTGSNEEALFPSLDFLNPDFINIRDSNIFANTDSRIKYVIFQNSIGMMNNTEQLAVIEGAGNNVETFDYPEFDYGIVPIYGNGPNYEEGYIHNKVHVYVVFRDEWTDEPIIYSEDDSRSKVKLDIDGQARIISDNNEFIETEF